MLPRIFSLVKHRKLMSDSCRLFGMVLRWIPPLVLLGIKRSKLLCAISDHGRSYGCRISRWSFDEGRVWCYCQRVAVAWFEGESEGFACGLCKYKPETTYDNFVMDFGERFVHGYSGRETSYWYADEAHWVVFLGLASIYWSLPYYLSYIFLLSNLSSIAYTSPILVELWDWTRIRGRQRAKIEPLLKAMRFKTM